MLKNLKIFILDADPHNRERYISYLQNMGFVNIFEFENTFDCLTSLNHQPNIIIIDQGIEPQLNIEAVKKIKAYNPDIYVIYVAENNNIQGAIQSQKYGAYDYFIKGQNEEYMINELFNRIMNIMNLLIKKPVATKYYPVNFFSL